MMPQIVPGSDNSVAIDLICTHIRRQLKGRKNRLRDQMALAGPRSRVASANNSPLIPIQDHFPNLIVTPETPQLKVQFKFPAIGREKLM